MKLFIKKFTPIFLLSLSTIALAQTSPELKWKVGGTIQAMGSYAQTNGDTAQIGIGLRRVRLKTSFRYGNVSAFIQYSAKNNSVVDARMTYKLSNVVNIRVGKFVGASIRAGSLTPHPKIDIVERPMSAQMWASKTVGSDYRDYGVSTFGKVGFFNYNLTLHNGKGTTNIIASHKKTATFINSSMAISGMIFFKPKSVKGLEAGGYYGIGNANINEYSSYNAYVYWQPNPIRIKVEVIGLTNIVENKDIPSLGYYVFGAYKISDTWELLARYENYDPNTDVRNNSTNLVTLGARYALIPAKIIASKITFAYVLHGQEGTKVDNNVFYVMFQTAL